MGTNKHTDPAALGNSQAKHRQPIPIHPLIFAAYFVLSLLGANITQLFPIAGFRSLLVVLALAAILLVLMRLVFRDWQRGALAASLVP
jgi:hypothetical protein